MELRALSTVPRDGYSTDAWWAFGLVGLSVTTEPDWLETPVFGDATLVSREVVKESILGDPGISDETKKRSLWLLGLDRAAVLEPDLARHEYRYVVPSSFVLVRRRGEQTDRAIYSKAYQRASEVCALVSVIAMTLEDSARTLAFAGQPPDPMLGPRACFAAGENLQLMGMGLHPYRYFPAPVPLGGDFHLSRSALLSPFNMGFHKELWKIVVERDVAVALGLRKVVVGALLRLFEAIHAPSFESRLMGAITSIEILLSDRNWETLKKRVVALLGTGSLSTYGVDELFRLRHAVVHERGDVSHLQALLAVGMAMSSLFTVALLSYSVIHVQGLHRYLDFVAAAQAADEVFSERERLLLDKVLFHRPAIHKWPWLDEIERVAHAGALLPDSTRQSDDGGEE